MQVIRWQGSKNCCAGMLKNCACVQSASAPELVSEIQAAFRRELRVPGTRSRSLVQVQDFVY